MSKDFDFDKIYKEIEKAVEALEAGDRSIGENIKLYKQTMDKINQAKEILRQAENEIKEITADETSETLNIQK